MTRKKWRFLAHYYHKIVVLIQVLLCVYILAKFSIYLRQFGCRLAWMYVCVNRIFVVSMLISIMLSLYRVHNRNRNHKRSIQGKYFIECGFLRFHLSAFHLMFHIHFSKYARSAWFCFAVFYCKIHPKTMLTSFFLLVFFSSVRFTHSSTIAGLLSQQM